jgi:hypothetical protein
MFLTLVPGTSAPIDAYSVGGFASLVRMSAAHIRFMLYGKVRGKEGNGAIPVRLCPSYPELETLASACLDSPGSLCKRALRPIIWNLST